MGLKSQNISIKKDDKDACERAHDELRLQEDVT